jgi:hypothetical protein
MPIALMCPNCSAGFSAKDEHAGRLAECPKCGQTLTIPGGRPPTPPAPPVLARPVAPRRATPVVTGQGDPPRTGRRRNDDEDAPRRRRRDEEEEDEEYDRSRRRRRESERDRPRRPRRRISDEPSAESKRFLLILLVIVLVATLLFCGAFVVVRFVIFQPTYVTAPTDTTSPAPQRPPNVKLTPESLRLVRHGAILSQVEDLWGAGEKADPDDLRVATAGLTRPPDVVERWQPVVQKGLVYRWREGADIILVAFSADPAVGGRVVGVISRRHEVPTEWEALSTRPAYTGPEGAIAVTAATLTKEYEADPVAAGAKYGGKLVKVTGVVGEVVPADNALHLIGHQSPQQGVAGRRLVVACRWPQGQILGEGAGHLKNQAVSITGKVQGVGGNTVVVLDSQMVLR